MYEVLLRTSCYVERRGPDLLYAKTQHKSELMREIKTALLTGCASAEIAQFRTQLPNVQREIINANGVARRHRHVLVPYSSRRTYVYVNVVVVCPSAMARASSFARPSAAADPRGSLW